MNLLTVREAADRLGVSAGLIYGLCARRQLRHERYGLGRGTIKIPEDAIDEFRRSVSVGGPDECPPARLPVKLKHLTV
jgi:excisionase family DNA binding protein